MERMKEFIVDVIQKGDYKLDELEGKIKKLFVLGDLTSEDMDYLLRLAADSVDDSKQVSLYNKVVELESRIEALETVDFVIYTAGYVTKRGQIIKFDLDKDGTYEYVTYLGGRTSTSLSPGKIEGWYKVTSTGVKTHSFIRNADGTFTLTPVEEETPIDVE